MKYYAVTDDPNELMHFGIKGMRWGIRRTDAQLGHPRHTGSKRPRSAAYKKAQSKLSAAMKNGIKAVEAHWNEYNSPQNKARRAYNRSEKKFQKHLQAARQGRLKYKGISDAEVERITDRLALERGSRMLSGTEKPSFVRRMRESAANGFVEGIGRGTAAYMEERWRGRGRTTADLKARKRIADYEREHAREIASDKVNSEYYEEAARRGYGQNWYETQPRTDSERAKQLQAWKNRDAVEEERKRRQRNIHDTYDKTYIAIRAKSKAKSLYGDSSDDKDKEKDKDKKKGNGQLPVTIIVNNGRRKPASYSSSTLPSVRKHKPRKGPSRGN